MPSPLEILAVDPALRHLSAEERHAVLEGSGWYPAPGEDDHTEIDLEREMKALAQRAPQLKICVLYRCQDEWFYVGAIRTGAGKIVQDHLTLSAAPGEAEHVEPEGAPEVCVVLEVPADCVADAVDAVAENEDFEVSGHRIWLPFRYRNAVEMTRAFAGVAARLEEAPPPFLVEVDGAFFQCRLDRRRGAETAPLWCWHDDAAVRGMAQAGLKQPHDEPVKEPPKRSPDPVEALALGSTPLSSGSARARCSAVDDAWLAVSKGRVIAGQPNPALWARLAAAVLSPANVGEKFDRVRARLYERLGKIADDRNASFLSGRITSESESLQLVLYRLVAKYETKQVANAIVQGFLSTSSEIRSVVTATIWRNELAIAQLTSHVLIPRWDDNETRNRILDLLDEECIKLAPVWVSDAPAAVREALNRFVSEA